MHVVMAPYEADGQLALLYRQRRVDRVVTNDSDLGVLRCRVVRLPPKGARRAIESSGFDGYDFDQGHHWTEASGPPPQTPSVEWLLRVCGPDALLCFAGCIRATTGPA